MLIELDPIVQRLPLRYKCLFWVYTLPGGLYAMIMLLLCSVNPFWFRDRAFRNLEHQIHVFGKWRDRKMLGYYEKYSLLETIKRS